jgi:crotonobetainyl-CoA:carnitine CoA-transferase CaiB-like acyl-CoA transferase
MQGSQDQPLAGLRVLDWTDAAGQLAGRILADLGAEVLLVEPPGGDPSRRAAAAGHSLGDQSAGWAARNFGKRSVEIDLKGAHGEHRLRELLSAAEVVIENRSAAERAAAGVDLDELRRVLPELVICSLSPYGRSGPRSADRGSDLTALALSGNLFMTGDPQRAPVRCSLPVSHYHSGAEAAAAVLMALFRRSRTGDGDLVDVSVQEVMATTNVSHTAQAWRTDYRGQRSGGAYRVGQTVQREIWECADGHVTFALRGGAARVPGLVAITEVMKEAGMAPPALTERDWSAYNHNRLTQAEVDELSAAFAAFFRSRTMQELYDLACERRLMLAPANSERQVISSRQLVAREFFVELPGGGAVIPARFAVAPGIGVRAQLPVAEESAGFTARGFPSGDRTGDASAGGIFAGLRIVEFGAGAAAPLATRYFADHGATVVKVESRLRPDFLRTLRDDGSGKLDHSLFFACVNPNKLSAGLNMKDPRGIALARRLVGWADVVVENFAPGVMARWGLDYESVQGDFPRLVMASTCLWGQTGPERAYPGFGGQGAALSGFNHLTGWPDGDPIGPFGTITDSLSPRFAAVAITAALLHRARTGAGAYIDLSQVESGVYCLTDWLLAYQTTGHSFGRVGNHSDAAVPHGVFPARGEDRWLALAVHSDEDWRALRAVMGDPDWARAREFDDLAGRLEQRRFIEERVSGWTSPEDAVSLAATLQRAGLDAAAVADLQDVLSDQQLAHRSHFNRLDHPVLGEHVVEAIGARFAAAPMRFDRSAPRLAADSEAVYCDLLGLPREEFRELADAGVLS